MERAPRPKKTWQWAYEPRCQVVGATPRVEGITAGMARISRDPTPIPALIREARQNTEQARKRNETIVYGYGHNSIAEHATFSVAIWDIPRSLSRRLVAHRLASYTQQSGRYIPFELIPRPYFRPTEYRRGHGARSYLQAISVAHAAYQEIYAACTAHLLATEPGLTRSAAARRATEDARYVLPLGHTTQVGMTANAREWGLVISRLLSGDLPEEMALGERLFARLQPLAPSLFPAKYIAAQPFPGTALQALANAALPLAPQRSVPKEAGQPVRLLECNPNAERLLAASLLYQALSPHADLDAVAASLSPEQIQTIIETSFTGLSAHDTVLRQFEFLEYLVEIECSEACLHQVLRHRMATQVHRRPTPTIGAVVPPLLVAAGQAERYLAALHCLADTHADLGGTPRADLLVGNGHRTRALLRLDARELIEFSRLRNDRHAQWEIQDLSRALVEAVRAAHPLIASACGGRDEYKAGLVEAGQGGGSA